MATVSAPPRRRIRRDDLFFLGMAVVAVTAVFVGFARTYFLAGLFRAPLPNLLIHIHGAVFTLWIVLFVTQIALVTSRQIALHRRLGLLGFGLAAAMVILGVLAASDRLARHGGEGPNDTPEGVRAFYAVGIGGIVLFATFVTLGYRNRRHPAVHKRLMLFATFSLLDAGFDRWPIFDPYPLWQVNLMCFGPLLLATFAYDWWSTGRVQKVTLWSAAFLLTVQQGRLLIGRTAPWQQLAARVELFGGQFERGPH